MNDKFDHVRRIYAAFAVRDLAAIAELVDPSIEIEYDGLVLDAVGSYHGYEGMRSLTGQILEAFAVDSFKVEVEELVEAPDGRVVAALHQTGAGRTSGAAVEIRIAQAWTIRDGKAVGWQIFRDIAHAREVVGLPS